ncbi:hypothetical protein ACOMHN_041155 [Nucella lapillus]
MQEECCDPRHVHLSLGEAPDQVNVMWSTRSPCLVTKVMYGTSPWQLQLKVTGTSANFTGPHSVRGLRHLHRATLTGLQEGKTYFYRPMCNRIGSGPFYFKSPNAHTNWSPRVMVSGDLGAGSQLLPLLSQRALSGQFSAALQLGGVSAYLSDDDNGTRKDQVLQTLQQTAAFLPLMTSPGDHERGGDSQLMVYSHLFSMPGSPWPPPRPSLWYSFDLGPVHFVSLCTAVYVHGDRREQQRQQQWLREDLQKANKARDKRPWIVAFTSHPLYCSPQQQQQDDIHCAHSKAILAAGLEDLLYSQGVDLILQSHTQGYQRLYPLYKGLALSSNYTQPPAPVHIVLGTSSPTPALTSPSTTHPPANVSGNSSDGGGGGGGDKPDSDIVALAMLNGSDPTYGFLHVINATHAHWELLSGGMGRDGVVLDTLWVVQDHHGPFRLSDLPKEAEDKIEMQQIPGKPGILNPHDGGTAGSGSGSPNPHAHSHPLEDVLQAVNSHRHLVVGLSLGVVVLLLALMILACRLRRKRRRGQRMVTRRWDSVDYKYGKTKLINDVGDDFDDYDDDDYKDGNDEGGGLDHDGLQTKKLITTRH